MNKVYDSVSLKASVEQLLVDMSISEVPRQVAGIGCISLHFIYMCWLYSCLNTLIV